MITIQPGGRQGAAFLLRATKKRDLFFDKFLYHTLQRRISLFYMEIFIVFTPLGGVIGWLTILHLLKIQG